MFGLPLECVKEAGIGNSSGSIDDFYAYATFGV